MTFRSILAVCLVAASSLFMGCATPAVPAVQGETWESDVNEAFEAEPSPDPNACTPTYCCGGGVCCICQFKNGTNSCVCSALLTD